MARLPARAEALATLRPWLTTRQRRWRLSCALAPSMLTLILARGLQGLGSGGLMPLVQTIIGDVASPRDRPRYQAYTSSTFIISTVGGPIVGGFIAEHLHWSWIFWFNLPLCGLAFLLTHNVLQRLPRHEVGGSVPCCRWDAPSLNYGLAIAHWPLPLPLTSPALASDLYVYSGLPLYAHCFVPSSRAMMDQSPIAAASAAAGSNLSLLPSCGAQSYPFTPWVDPDAYCAFPNLGFESGDFTGWSTVASFFADAIEPPVDTPYGDRRAMFRDAFGNIYQAAHRSAK